MMEIGSRRSREKMNGGLRISKRGQTAGQVLTYVMAMILISLIVVFGYKAIVNFLHQTDYIAMQQFKSDLESTLKKMSYKDTIYSKTFTVPPEYKTICLTSNTEERKANGEKLYSGNIDGLPITGVGKINPLVKSQWMNTDNNVFLFSGIDSFNSFSVRNEDGKVIRLHLDTDGDGADDDQEPTSNMNQISHICQEINGKLTLRIESYGKYVFVSSNISQRI